MNIDEVMEDLADSRGRLPRDSMAWALQHWDVAGPRFLALIEAAADGRELSWVEQQALFLVVHLCAERCETAAFAPIVRYLGQPESADILDDAATETLSGVLISTYDGQLNLLEGLIESPAVDEFVRSAAMQVIAYLTHTGALTEAHTRAYLVRLRAEMQPQDESYIWAEWAIAAANLGYGDLRGDVEALLDKGFINPKIMDASDFERMARGKEVDAAPFTDAIGRFSKWYAFTPKFREDNARRHAEMAAQSRLEEAEEGPWSEPGAPLINPYRDVGRNDPCPCGSGKKFKKCCLETV
jgi:hypothetical protein